ncbi:hypothetical protein KFK09_028040 [Dendrobium nobile]|uniref:Uncharacterized protein n=1 Tax=Dendrobium nobile TaxID=94219 RepID=A0A8T3A6B9_DENNO|nr:hypothetical protein KFK09_028040 [Dendrobium nobile]
MNGSDWFIYVGSFVTATPTILLLCLHKSTSPESRKSKEKWYESRYDSYEKSNR